MPTSAPPGLGDRHYTLHVPANPPAKLFWLATVYSVDTRCLIDNQQGRGDRGSRDPDLQFNDDGSGAVGAGQIRSRPWWQYLVLPMCGGRP